MTTAGPEYPTGLTYKDFLRGGNASVDLRLLESVPWKAINDFLEAVGSERTLLGLAGRLLSEIERVLPFDFGFTAVTSTGTPHLPRIFLDLHTPAGLLRDYFGRYISIDPCLPQLPASWRGTVEWAGREDEFSRDFLSKYGTQHSVTLSNLPASPEAGFVVVLHRAGRAEFTEREKAACYSLLPHLHNLYALILGPETERKRLVERAAAVCGLTPREQEVAVLFCAGLTASEIAHRLCVSTRTVQKHVEHIYARLRVHTRRGLSEELVLTEASLHRGM